MVEPVFTLKPSLSNAIVPVFFRRLWYLMVGGAISYALFWGVARLGLLPLSLSRLLLATVAVVLLFAIVSVKHMMIRLHSTNYLFYDTHVVEQVSIINKRRRSMPYKQIAKVTNDSSLWDRLTNASDIRLHSSRHGDGHDLVLRSIRDSDEVEHRIYGMLGKPSPTDQLAA